ncbi:glycerophosphodiester phosphodiesterase 1 [Sphaerodactylus townsendi]|uniref:glycerophosphodiester phosphodiesterase 1 n=1 Tax=Sphaerodactylus townsendi TaxID=933632 RepID=UPI0020274564|nr:glycerophosphodiester phosphodiesterase 1 [Sphaerodactylus townsendi]
MFCYPAGLVAAFSAVLLASLALSRSAALSCVLTGGLYLALRLFSLEPASPQRAQLVVQPHGRPARIAHRGGGHDAPENTLAAIRQIPSILFHYPMQIGRQNFPEDTVVEIC